MSTTTTSQLQYTCLSCNVAFHEAELQRFHYKTDWHRYNLKRRVAELPPVTAESFQLKVLNQRSIDENLNKPTTTYCTVCKKSFANEKAYDNHIQSKKHKENERNYLERSIDYRSSASEDRNVVRKDVIDEEIEEVDSDEWDEEDDENPIDKNNCIFCAHHSGSFLKNLDHMTTVHSFFIPDVEFCTDLQGLLKYLGEKVSEGYMCLWCNDKGKTFHSAEAAQQHMTDKGHCKMVFEGLALAEYTDYYDYSSSYPDATNQDIDIDEEISNADQELDGSDYQLVLPSGIVIGHRSLMRYYKQSINSTNSVVPISKDKKKLHKVLAHYRSLGWTDTQQKAAAKRARDIHYMKRIHAQWNLKLNLKTNKLQKHFRQQTNF